MAPEVPEVAEAFWTRCDGKKGPLLVSSGYFHGIMIQLDHLCFWIVFLSVWDELLYQNQDFHGTLRCRPAGMSCRFSSISSMPSCVSAALRPSPVPSGGAFELLVRKERLSLPVRERYQAGLRDASACRETIHDGNPKTLAKYATINV